MNNAAAYIERLIKKHGTALAVAVLKNQGFPNRLFFGSQNYPYGIALDDHEGNTYRVGLCKGFSLHHHRSELSESERVRAENTVS